MLIIHLDLTKRRLTNFVPRERLAAGKAVSTTFSDLQLSTVWILDGKDDL